MEDLVFYKKGDDIPVFKEGTVILVDKPSEWTSFNVVSAVRYRVSKIDKVKRIKVGHAGTLDPLATGLLIVCTGKYTKKLEQFQAQTKRYSGTITVGATRPTYDMESDIDAHFPTDHITDELVASILPQFQGDVYQKPPIFSAIKKDGERLYKKARRGETTETVEIKERKIHIYNFEITSRNGNDFDFILDCSKGTYVRSLAFDFGGALESGAYLKRLQRDKIGDFDLKNAWDFEELRTVLNEQVDKGKENVS